MYFCTQCGAAYPDRDLPYRCPVCAGYFDYMAIPYQPPLTETNTPPGIWRFRASFGLPAQAPVISLGEGNTPLVWIKAFGYRVALKCEYQNPTGSFKDRGSATLTSFLSSRGAVHVVEDSSGNAGSSLAAYAARAGISATIYVPQTASGPKRVQIGAYGAEVIPVPGRRSHASELAQQAVREGMVYASHAFLPFNLPGYATIAYEVVEQLGQAPGTFICPAGQGGLLLGAARGFTAMQAVGRLERYPKLIGVQAQVCAPLAERYTHPDSSFQGVEEADTLAEGVRISNPLRAKEVIRAVRSSQGDFISVRETEIQSGRDELACRGFYVEMTSAIVWNALAQAINGVGTQRLPEPVVLVLTGSGLKTA